MIIVGGITRSGLSLMMQMLEAGGYPVVGNYPAFEEYPLRKIPWRKIGKRAVKVVDLQLQFPPKNIDHKTILLRRSYTEQAKSINKFNSVFGLPSAPLNDLILSLKRDYIKIDNWLFQRNRPFIRIQFENLIREPERTATQIRVWLDQPLNIDKMTARVRSREVTCLPYLLEAELLKSMETPMSTEAK